MDTQTNNDFIYDMFSESMDVNSCTVVVCAMRNIGQLHDVVNLITSKLRNKFTNVKIISNVKLDLGEICVSKVTLQSFLASNLYRDRTYFIGVLDMKTTLAERLLNMVNVAGVPKRVFDTDSGKWLLEDA